MEFFIDDWLVRTERNEIVNGSMTRKLEPRVMDLLQYLAEHPGEVQSHDQMIANVWPHTYVSDGALQTAVSALRKAFGDNLKRPRIVETIPKRGYRLIASSSAAKPVVAVLPFKNLTGNAKLDYLADGLTDLLIAELGCFGNLRVISRHSVMTFRDSRELLPGIAARLNAHFVVEGSMLLDGDDLCTTVQLIDASSDTHEGSETYRTSIGRMRESQRRIAHAIIDWLPATRPPKELPPPRTIHPEAMTCYLRGRFHFYKLSPEHFPLALEHLAQAVAIEPGFAAAHAAIADVWGGFGYWGAIPAAEAGPKVRAALARAEAADPDDAETNAIFGAMHTFIDYDWDAARSRLDRAVRLNPDLASAHLLRALLLATTRDPSAVDAANTSKNLDPLNPAVMLARALCLVRENRLDEAAEEVRQMFEIAPDFRPAIELDAELAWLACDDDALDRERRHWADDESVLKLLQGPTSDGDPTGAMLAVAELLQARANETLVPPRVLARQFSLAGKPETALAILENAISRRELMQIDFVQTAPAFVTVRALPGYEAVLRGIGLA